MNLLVEGEITGLGLLAIAASIVFVLSIGQPNGAKYRIWALANVGMWCLYDIFAKSLSAMLIHGPLLLFIIAGAILHDRKKNQ